MKLVGIMPVRNEDWILGLSLRVALQWCDQVVVFMHACSDETVSIVADLIQPDFNRIIPLAEESGSWEEMSHRHSMLLTARRHGATHVAMIDADEVLTANLVPHIRGVVEKTPPGCMLDLPLYNLRNCFSHSTHGPITLTGAGPMQYHTNGVWGNRWVATAFADRPELHWAGDGFHHREPFGHEWRGHRYRPINHPQGGVLHFWGASERRLRAKHALYRITERLRWPNKTAADIEYVYDPATNPYSVLAQKMRVAGPWEFAAVKPEWIEPYADLMQYLHIDKEPWQEAEVRRLVLEHGVEKFSGLDLLGVPEWS
jgi:Glycosyl transferase family 2